MNKQAFLEETYNSAFEDEFKKHAGIYSESFGYLNPLNLIAGGPAAIAAAITPTKTKKQMVEQQKKTWSNFLIPGANTYRALKRIGYSAKGNYGGAINESLGPMINPLEDIAAIPAAIGAVITPTITKKQMDELNKKRLSNILIPGAGSYRHYKRLGYTQKELNKEVTKQSKNK